MTEEKVDQVIRCVKECWWRVGILLALIFGFVLLAMHGWPEGDWIFGWGAIGALGTIFTGGVAVKIAYSQKKSNDERVKNSEWIALKSTLQEVNEARDCITEILLTVEEIAKGGTNEEKRAALVDYCLRKASQIKRIKVDVVASSYLDPDLTYECSLINEALKEFKRELSEVDLDDALSQDKGDILVLRNLTLMLTEIMEGSERFYELAGFLGAKGSYSRRRDRVLTGLMRQSGF